MFTFHRNYFILALGLFLLEVFIAVYVHDRFFRPYIGDYLVVIFLYYLVKAFIRLTALQIALGVLLFAYTVEFLQYLDLVSFLGLSQNSLAKTILGSSFEWLDMLTYTLGIATVLFLDYPDRKYTKTTVADPTTLL